ncbi:MAG TPA: ferredoxin reductase [Jatrophihabitantaceae bacterium]|jgi:ferredoxin-NADP reductase
MAAVSEVRVETATARTLVLDVPGWPGHDAGQHVDVRLTAPDGYTAVRSYSIASVVAEHGAPTVGPGASTITDGDRIEITVEPVVDGEVSSYLAGVAAAGDELEVRGPIGGWFAWRPAQTEPVQLIGGGSGVVPLMAMVRARTAAASSAPFRLLYSTRRPQSVIYRSELERRAADGLPFTLVYTRSAPPGWARPPGRIDAALLAATTFAPDEAPTCYVCGPTPFVEAVADQLLAAGHDPGRVRTERFGGQS